MKEFKTSPTVWSVDGNVIGEELGYLNNLPKYNSHFAKIVQGNPVNFGGYNHNSLVMTFDTDNLLDRETSRTLNAAKFPGGNCVATIVDNPDGSGEQVLELNPDGTSHDSRASIVQDTGGIRLGMVKGGYYTVTGQIYVPSSTGLSPNHSSGLRILFFRRVGGNYASNSSLQPTSTNQWQNLNISDFISSDHTESFIRLYNGFNTVGKKVYFRRLKVQQRNILTPNQATGTDTLANTTGFGGLQGGVFSSTEWSSEGGRSIKCVTEGVNGRMQISLPEPVKGDITYPFVFDFKGESGKEYSVQLISHTPYSFLYNTDPNNNFTATGANQTISYNIPVTQAQLNSLNPDTAFSLLIRQISSGAGAFYADKLYFLKPLTGFSPGVE